LGNTDSLNYADNDRTCDQLANDGFRKCTAGQFSYRKNLQKIMIIFYLFSF